MLCLRGVLVKVVCKAWLPRPSTLTLAGTAEFTLPWGRHSLEKSLSSEHSPFSMAKPGALYFCFLIGTVDQSLTLRSLIVTGRKKQQTNKKPECGVLGDAVLSSLNRTLARRVCLALLSLREHWTREIEGGWWDRSLLSLNGDIFNIMLLGALCLMFQTWSFLSPGEASSLGLDSSWEGSLLEPGYFSP